MPAGRQVSPSATGAGGTGPDAESGSGSPGDLDYDAVIVNFGVVYDSRTGPLSYVQGQAIMPGGQQQAHASIRYGQPGHRINAGHRPPLE
jgi:hypothetical protein